MTWETKSWRTRQITPNALRHDLSTVFRLRTEAGRRNIKAGRPALFIFHFSAISNSALCPLANHQHKDDSNTIYRSQRGVTVV